MTSYNGNMDRRQCHVMDTVRAKIEGELFPRRHLYDVFGFFRSQFQTNGATMRDQSSIDARISSGYKYKSQRYFIFVLLGVLICEMYSCLVGVAGLPIMGGGRHRVDPPIYRGMPMRPRRGAHGGIRGKSGWRIFKS